MLRTAKRLLEPADVFKFLSSRARRRKPSAIRELAPLMGRDDLISLAGGIPSPDCFAISDISFSCIKGGRISGNSAATCTLSPDLLGAALQYSSSFGLPQLRTELRKFIERDHKAVMQYYEPEILVGTGSQDLLPRIFDALLDPEDVIFVENPTYSGALAALHPTGATVVGIKTSPVSGMDPIALAEGIAIARLEGRHVKAVYVVPTGANPTGGTMPESKRQELYKVASDADILIVEDDPYRYLSFRDGPAPPSILSIDVDGRVVRCDSFSKVLSAGLRIGWATGPKPLLDVLQLDLQACGMHPSGVSQAIVAQILSLWTDSGWDEHIAILCAHYRQKRDAFLEAATRHLVTPEGHPLAKWTAASAGLFVWFELDSQNKESASMKKLAEEAKVVAVPGSAFTPAWIISERAIDENDQPDNHLRCSFSVVPIEQMDEAMARTAKLLQLMRKSA